MYAYQMLHSELLSNLCRLLAAILEKSAAEQVRWQVGKMFIMSAEDDE